MSDKKSEFSEIVSDMFRFTGALAGAAVVAGKKLICYVNDLTAVDTVLKPPADKNQASDVMNCKTNTKVDKKS